MDLTGEDLRDAVIGLAAADVAISNDSGLLHVAAALGTRAIGLFGPTSPRRDGPLNPLAAGLEADWRHPCPACGRTHCDEVRHRRVEDIRVDTVARAVLSALAA
jgi:heptosyltransferase-2